MGGDFIDEAISESSLKPLCPKCKRELTEEDSRYNRFFMTCPNHRCDFNSIPFDGTYFALIQRVLVEIGGRIRSGEYKNPHPITYYTFRSLFDVSDPKDWFPFFEVKEDGVWQKIPSEEDQRLLTLKHRKQLFDYPNPVLRLPCNRQELEKFSQEFLPEDMIRSMREKLNNS